MQIILLERIGKLGQMGDVVTVKDGYARNYLLPQGKALRATKPNLERFERERVQLEALNLERKKEADAVAARIDKQNIIIIRQAGETGQLYGSVSTRDIASSVSDAGYKVGRQQILLDRPIKSLGVHPVRISLHPEVEVTVNINVARTDEEAARQARGEDVTALTDEPVDEREDAIGVEEVFEDEELAKEIEEELKEEEQLAEAEAEAEQAESGTATGDAQDEEDAAAREDAETGRKG